MLIPLDNLSETQIEKELERLVKLGGMLPPAQYTVPYVKTPLKDGNDIEYETKLTENTFRPPTTFESLAFEEISQDKSWTDFTPQGLQKYIDQTLPKAAKEAAERYLENERQNPILYKLMDACSADSESLIQEIPEAAEAMEALAQRN